MTEIQQLIVMGFGTVVALAGLGLLFLKKEGAKNRIKLLGQEFELSTPALVVFLVGSGIFILPFVVTQGLGKPPGNSSIIPIPPVSLGSKEIAEFYGPWPRNKLDMEWHIFSDGKWGGKSTIRYEMKPREKSAGFYMSIHFALGPSLPLNPEGKAYCGVYTEFSFPPAGVVDLSTYRGIEFRARYRGPDGEPNPEDDGAVEFLLQVARYDIPDYRYHEAFFDLTRNALNFKQTKIEFSQLVTPSWSSKTYQFDKIKVFRIALVIKSNRPANGQLDFHSMYLF